MTQKVNILIGTLSNGGAERVVSNISMYLTHEIELNIILFGSNAEIKYPYKGNITYLDNATLNSPISKFKTLITRIKVLKKIKKKCPNVPIISFLEYPNLINVLSGKKNSIVSVRNFMSTKHKKGLKAFFWNFTIKHFYKKAGKVIVVSKKMKKDLIDNYSIPEEKIKVIYNSYPISEIQSLADENITNEEQEIFKFPTVITAGRLNEQKGQTHLLRSFSKVRDAIPEAQLVFLGEGSLEKDLKKLAKELGVQKGVHFYGFQDNPFKYISKARAFALTSYYEGFPNALAEAMACKTPVISTDCQSGPREILAPEELEEDISYNVDKGRYGVLVPDISSNDPYEIEESIAESIIKILNSKDQYNYYSNKAYDRVKDFSIEKIISEWEEVIKGF